MASVIFFVRSRKKNPDDVTIRARFTNGRSCILNGKTKMTIPMKAWDSRRETIKDDVQIFSDTFTDANAQVVVDTLKELRSFILSEFNKTNGVELYKEWLQNIIDQYSIKKIEEQKRPSRPINIFEYMKRYGEEIQSGKRLNLKNQRYSPDTVKSRLYSFRVLQNFMIEYKPNCNYDDITMEFYRAFVHFCNERKYSPQTTGKHIKALKEIMAASRKEQIHNNLQTTTREFKTLSGTSDTIYLTANEVNAMENVDLSAFPQLKLACDIFLCGIYTLQRFSDYSRINPANIIPLSNNKKAVKLKQAKTGTEVVIPVSSSLDSILKKYNYTLPKITSQKLNRDIKDVAYLANIVSTVEHHEQKGIEIVKTLVEKYKLISSHTARRTGATLLYLETRNTLACMKLTGHKTEKEFLKYIRFSAEENAIMLSDLDYFS